MKKTDLELGMGQDITRRDFIHDTGVHLLQLAPVRQGDTTRRPEPA
jgi:hypothetical protein